MRRKSAWLSLALGLALFGGGRATADYWDVGVFTDNSFGNTRNELVHGTSQQHDLEANGGGLEGLVADQDWYIVISDTTSSYEAVIDGTGGDINFVGFDRIAEDGTTVLQSSDPANPGGAGAGFSRALRWQNTATTGIADKQYLRVQSGNCTTDCLPKDQYHIRFYETTVSVPRFNNFGTQVTVLIIQNATGWFGLPINGTIYFWDSLGALVASHTFSDLGRRAALVLNTATVPGAAGVGGTITVTHDGGYGNLTMKSVALEPATGFSFDTPGLYKPH